MDATEAAALIKRYFEVSLNTSAFLMETVSSLLNPISKKWEIIVIVKPIYTAERKFKVTINPQSKAVETVEQTTQ